MKTALIIVDVQNDFCPGGALPVPHGDEVVAPLNKWIEKAEREQWVVIATRDWHPRETNHFAEFGGRWPVHCMRQTEGVKFHPGLTLPESAIIVSKGSCKDEDAYSGFDGFTLFHSDYGLILTRSLSSILRRNEITHLYIGGLATDYCVKATALDARRRGFDTYLILDACRAVNVNPGDGDKAVEEMKAAGVKLISVLSKGE